MNNKKKNDEMKIFTPGPGKTLRKEKVEVGKPKAKKPIKKTISILAAFVISLTAVLGLSKGGCSKNNNNTPAVTTAIVSTTEMPTEAAIETTTEVVKPAFITYEEALIIATDNMPEDSGITVEDLAMAIVVYGNDKDYINEIAKEMIKTNNTDEQAPIRWISALTVYLNFDGSAAVIMPNSEVISAIDSLNIQANVNADAIIGEKEVLSAEELKMIEEEYAPVNELIKQTINNGNDREEVVALLVALTNGENPGETEYATTFKAAFERAGNAQANISDDIFRQMLYEQQNISKVNS